MQPASPPASQPSCGDMQRSLPAGRAARRTDGPRAARHHQTHAKARPSGIQKQYPPGASPSGRLTPLAFAGSRALCRWATSTAPRTRALGGTAASTTTTTWSRTRTWGQHSPAPPTCGATTLGSGSLRTGRCGATPAEQPACLHQLRPPPSFWPPAHLRGLLTLRLRSGCGRYTCADTFQNLTAGFDTVPITVGPAAAGSDGGAREL